MAAIRQSNPEQLGKIAGYQVTLENNQSLYESHCEKVANEEDRCASGTPVKRQRKMKGTTAEDHSHTI